MRTYLFAFVAALIASFILTKIVRDIAIRFGWTDKPDLNRKRHAVPTPAVGGIAIYISVVISLIVTYYLPTGIGELMRSDPKMLVTIIGLSGIMMIIGLVDDIRGLSPLMRFVCEALLAILCWCSGFQITMIWAGKGSIYLIGILSLPLTVLWIVGITNAFNLIDGIDGLSSGAALFATLALLGSALLGYHWLSVLILASFAGAILGFLKYNFNPASIFLGDSGSLSLGFVLSVIAIESSQKSSAAMAIGVPIVAFGFPLIDTVVSIVRRFASGKPIFQGDRRHIHHMLLARGLTPKRTVTLLYGVCALFGLVSLLFLNPTGGTVGLAFAVLGTCLWIGIRKLKYTELRELNAHVARGIHNQRKLITGSVNVGRMIDDLKASSNLGQLLESLSRTLHEMEFSRAELLVPCYAEYGHRQQMGWIHIRESNCHCLFVWDYETMSEHRAIGQNGSSSRGFTENDFKLEYLFRFQKPSVALWSENLPSGQEIVGRIAFYHSINSEYPVSAISILSQNVWKEFRVALERIVEQQGFCCEEETTYAMSGIPQMDAGVLRHAAIGRIQQ
jgi:UDP-GlcNAc:undecaprenyl-phosphate/decaprenyl-phosphate GlcNAc-1-phosphate transferase